MTPYFETEHGKLYCGDCMDIIQTIENVDLVITDPPYGMNYQSNYRVIKYEKIQNDDRLPIEVIKIMIEKAHNAAYFFCRWDNLYDMPRPKSFISWVKNNHSMGDLEHEHGRMWEGICFYPKQNHVFIKRIPDVLLYPRTGNIYHPTQKPVGLIREIIAANVCGNVFDPYIGSGSTAVACEKLGKKWIGVEISEEFCEIAAKRILNETKQRTFDFKL